MKQGSAVMLEVVNVGSKKPGREEGGEGERSLALECFGEGTLSSQVCPELRCGGAALDGPHSPLFNKGLVWSTDSFRAFCESTSASCVVSCMCPAKHVSQVEMMCRTRSKENPGL